MRGKLAWALPMAGALLPIAGVAAMAEERAPISISDIRQESTDRSTRLTVECTGPVAYTSYSPDPLTLVVDIPEVDASKVPARINVGTREVDSLRVTTLSRADGRSIARLEVRLASLAPFQIYQKDRALNLVFQRGGESAARTEPPPAAARAGGSATPRTRLTLRPGRPTRRKPASARRRPAKVAADVASRRLPDATPATQIVGVVPATEDGQLTVTVRADGRLEVPGLLPRKPGPSRGRFQGRLGPRPQVRTLSAADRFSGSGSASSASASPKVARLVLDLSSRAPYHFVEARDGVKIVFGEGMTPKPAPLAALRPAVEPRGFGALAGDSGQGLGGAGRASTARAASGSGDLRRRPSTPRPLGRRRSNTRASRSPWTSERETSRTSSASSRTSAGSTSS